MTATVHLLNCVVCDDVRIEILQKETIVGVYTGAIVVPSLPWAAMLCLWLTVIWSGDGQLPIQVRVLNPRQAEVGTQQDTGTAMLQGMASTITFRGLFLTFEMEGTYTFQWKPGAGEWETMRQLPVYMFRPNPAVAS
jgi:hypothetical protein